MSRVLHGMPLESLPNPGELQAGDQIVAYREDTGKAYRSNIAGLGASANQNITDAFNVLTNYSAGDYCIYNDTLYRFTTDHLGDWNDDDVVATNVGLELGTQTTDISNVNDYVAGIVTQLNNSISNLQTSLQNDIKSVQSSISSLPLVQYGTTSITYSANASTTKTVTFSTKFASTPVVTLSLVNTGTVLGWTDIGVYVSSVSTSQVVIRVTANGNYNYTATVHWIAVGKQ